MDIDSVVGIWGLRAIILSIKLPQAKLILFSLSVCLSVLLSTDVVKSRIAFSRHFTSFMLALSIATYEIFRLLLLR